MTSWTFSWTPGPWWWEDNVLESERRAVLTTRSRLGRGTGEDIANAHLIAAAPDIYEALKAIGEMFFARPDMAAALRPLMGPAEDAVCARAMAVLAKARGEA